MRRSRLLIFSSSLGHFHDCVLFHFSSQFEMNKLTPSANMSITFSAMHALPSFIFSNPCNKCSVPNKASAAHSIKPFSFSSVRKHCQVQHYHQAVTITLASSCSAPSPLQMPKDNANSDVLSLPQATPSHISSFPPGTNMEQPSSSTINLTRRQSLNLLLCAVLTSPFALFLSQSPAQASPDTNTMQTRFKITFPVTPRISPQEIKETINIVEDTKEWPFNPFDFKKYDNQDDAVFYARPRLVYHIDDAAKAQLELFYSDLVQDMVKNVTNNRTPDFLDICSSWVSYLPSKFYKGSKGPPRAVALGMNEIELKQNPHTNEYIVQDLNKNPSLPFDDKSLDLVTCNLSIDYLTRPLEIMKEISRVLRPSGVVVLSFSNRMFVTKATSLWTGSGDIDHIYASAMFIKFAGGFQRPLALDVSPVDGDKNPLYVVLGVKSP